MLRFSFIQYHIVSKERVNTQQTNFMNQRFKALLYYAGLDKSLRTKNQDKFLKDDSRYNGCYHCLWNGY